MDRELLRRLLAAGAFFGLIFGLAFLTGVDGSNLAPPGPLFGPEPPR